MRVVEWHASVTLSSGHPPRLHLRWGLLVHRGNFPALQHIDDRRPRAGHAASGAPVAAGLLLWWRVQPLLPPCIERGTKLRHQSQRYGPFHSRRPTTRRMHPHLRLKQEHQLRIHLLAALCCLQRRPLLLQLRPRCQPLRHHAVQLQQTCAAAAAVAAAKTAAAAAAARGSRRAAAAAAWPATCDARPRPPAPVLRAVRRPSPAAPAHGPAEGRTPAPHHHLSLMFCTGRPPLARAPVCMLPIALQPAASYAACPQAGPP